MSLIVAVAGATGDLGVSVVTALLSATPKPTVRVLTRSDTGKAAELAAKGAELHIVDYEDSSTVAKALQGADVLISTVGTKATSAAKLPLIKTALEVESIKLIIPSEFGVDIKAVDFSSPEWDIKRDIEKLLTSQTKAKAVFIYTGLFLETGFGPWLGFNAKEKKFYAVGKNSPYSLTSIGDIGRATAAAALKSPEDHVFLRIESDTVTVEEAAKTFSEVSGETIEVVYEDFDAFKAKVAADYSNVLGALRLFIGDGRMNHSIDNGNDYVNPGGKSWKWKTVKDYAVEVGGKPFA